MVVMVPPVPHEDAPIQAQPADHDDRQAKRPPEPPQNAMEHCAFLFWMMNIPPLKTSTLCEG